MTHTPNCEPLHCEKCCVPLEMGTPITVEFGYGHPLDEIKVHFCSDECLISYLRKEEKKRKKDDRFIFGKMKGKKK